MIYANGFAQQDKDYFHSISERTEAVRRLSVNNLTMVENVIKQGYLKRGSSYENRFSGLIDKIIPRKWYMLVVRGRVPFLEQFDRDVDVFSGPPSVSYNLSNCTAVSHCMAQTPRAFTFVISCADRLIELTAASREQMIDWCDVLERTLNSLGILRKEKEEHIYTFCPAVVFSGRSKKEEESENEETLGAVGGTPVSPPPRHPPPLPSGHPSGLPRAGPEKAPPSPLKEPTPPPLPSSLPPPLRRSQSPTSLQPPTEQAPLPPVSKTHQLLSPPCHSVSSPPPFPPLYEPPPLPPARHHIPSLSVSTPPPPLPPARHHIEDKPMESALCGTEVNPPRQHKFHLEVLSQENGDSDQESADYSSDFVSEAFWEINRRIPVPTARHSVLSGKPKSNSSASATDVEELGEGDISDETECQSSGQAQEELDEGYSGLALVKMLKKSRKDVQHPAQSASPVQMSSVQRLGSHDGVVSENSSSTFMPVPEERCSGTDCESGISHSFDNQVENVTCSSDVVAEFSVREADPNAPQNFYSAFPVRETSHQVTTMENGFGDADETTEKHMLVEEPVQNSEFSLFQQENPYDVVFKASSVVSSSDVPPLPPRHDSLLKRNIENASPNMVCDDDTSSDSANSSSSSDETEVFVHKPAPVPPKTFQHVSSAPSDLNSHGVSRKTHEMPPLLPPRRGSRFNRGLSVDTAELSPPPLPARKAQSVRVQRPRTAPPHSSSSACADKASSLWYPGCEESSNQVVEQNPPSKRPQQNQRVRKESTAAENDLRHRMRLDRAHSVHSVISLKQSQAEILRQEMELSGVSVTVNLRAALHIAFVDCVGLVCIAGWNQIDFPSLHGKFHIGDQVLSIQNVKVTSVAMAVKLIKQQTSDVIEVLVKRLPYGQVFAIRRSAEGESLGIRRTGGTAEIEYVDPHGLAASNGLPLRPSGVLSDKRTTWTLTEINSRHLSLFFKDLEIEHRLNAVGREITIVVQPSDYMCELKKQLKKMKNYKSFVVQ